MEHGFLCFHDSFVKQGGLDSLEGGGIEGWGIKLIHTNLKTCSCEKGVPEVQERSSGTGLEEKTGALGNKGDG
jgi:hypothetical protein